MSDYRYRLFPRLSMVRTSEGDFYVEEYPSGRYLGKIPQQLGECLLTQEVDKIPSPQQATADQHRIPWGVDFPANISHP